MVIIVKIDRDGVTGVRGKTKEDMDALPDSGTRRTLHLQDVSTGPENAIAVLSADGPSGCFPTMGKARATLMDLWFEAHGAIAVRDGTYREPGEALLPVEGRNNRVANPVPRNVGCPYASWSGANKCTYW